MRIRLAEKELIDPKVHDYYKRLAEYAVKNGLQVVLDLEMINGSKHNIDYE